MYSPFLGSPRLLLSHLHVRLIYLSICHLSSPIYPLPPSVRLPLPLSRTHPPTYLPQSLIAHLPVSPHPQGRGCMPPSSPGWLLTLISPNGSEEHERADRHVGHSWGHYDCPRHRAGQRPRGHGPGAKAHGTDSTSQSPSPNPQTRRVWLCWRRRPPAMETGREDPRLSLRTQQAGQPSGCSATCPIQHQQGSGLRRTGLGHEAPEAPREGDATSQPGSPTARRRRLQPHSPVTWLPPPCGPHPCASPRGSEGPRGRVAEAPGLRRRCA